MNDLSGHSIGRYHIIEPLGEGGMANVFKAYDTHLECEVAVKVIRIERISPEILSHALKRFEREAKLVAKLTHPNIVKVTDYGEYENRPYLVMEYLPGGTLKEFIKQHKQISWQEAVKLLKPIAEALQYAHYKGVIHRDIKPSNILLTQNGFPMLTDFGVAKIIDDEVTQDLTGPSATLGTPEYMAPEQIASKTVDGRADLYALGVVFYEMITGRRPYEADTPMAVIIMHSRDPLPQASKFVKDIPERVERFLEKALAKAPSDRYQSAQEMAAALQNLSELNQVIKPIKPTKDIKLSNEDRTIQQNVNILPRRRTQKPFWIGLVLFGIILLLGSGFLLIRFGIGVKRPTQNIVASITPSIKNTPPIITATATMTITLYPTPTNTKTPEPSVTSSQKSNYLEFQIDLNNHAACRTGPDGRLFPLTGEYVNGLITIEGVDKNRVWGKLLGSISPSCWIYLPAYSYPKDVAQNVQIIITPTLESPIIYAVDLHKTGTPLQTMWVGGFPSESCARSYATTWLAYCAANSNQKLKQCGSYNSSYEWLQFDEYGFEYYVESTKMGPALMKEGSGLCTYSP